MHGDIFISNVMSPWTQLKTLGYICMYTYNIQYCMLVYCQPTGDSPELDSSLVGGDINRRSSKLIG